LRLGYPSQTSRPRGNDLFVVRRAVAVCTALLLCGTRVEAQRVVVGQRFAAGSATHLGNGVLGMSGRLAFQAGVFFDVGLGEYLGARLETSYASAGTSFAPRPTTSHVFSTYLDEVGHDLVTRYIQIPLLLEATLPTSKVLRIYLSGGIEEAFAIGCDLESAASITGVTTTRWATIYTDCGESVTGTDSGWLLGGGIEWKVGTRRLGLSLRYAESFRAAYTGNCSEFELDTGPNCFYNTGFDAKNRMITLGVDLGFLWR